MPTARLEPTSTFWRARASETVASWRDMLSTRTLGLDIGAGLTVACVALPLNLALAIASGVPAGVGLVTGVVAGIVAALFGGSRLQVTGPAAAMVPLVFEIVQRHGLKGLIVATFICGLVQIALGAARIGRLVQAFPVSVIAGFMSGIGLLILGGQLPRLLGLPAEVKSLTQLVKEPSLLGQVNPSSVLIAAGVLVAIVLLPRLHKRLPAALLGLAVMTAVAIFGGLSLPAVGEIPRTLSWPSLPTIAGVDLVALLPEALAMAALASVESLLSAVVVDTMAKTPRHSSDQELIGQGLANLTSALFGGLPVTGVIVRSSVAVQSGGRTRMTSLVHAVALLGCMLAIGTLVAKVPLAALAAILISVGWRLVDAHELKKLWRISRFEAGIFVATMLGIVLTDFIDGVLIGLVLALIHFAHSHRTLDIAVHAEEPSDALRSRGAEGPRHRVVRVEGPIFFASHTQLEALAHDPSLPPKLVLDLGRVPSIDVTGLQTLRALVDGLADRGIAVGLAAAPARVAEAIERAGLSAHLWGGRVHASVRDALAVRRALPHAGGHEHHDHHVSGGHHEPQTA